MKYMKRKVVIFGGGIGGLSAAHELSKYQDIFDITLVERNGHLGGQAAELYKKDKHHTAVCWHAISSNYKYFLDIMDEIYLDDGSKTISHLKPLNRFIYATEKIHYVEYENSFVTSCYKEFMHKFYEGYKALYETKPPLKDMLILYYLYIKANIISEKKLEKYDQILWKDTIKYLSPNVKRWVLDSISIYLGMDYNKISTHFVFSLMRKQNYDTKLNKRYSFYSFDGSMLTVLFNPWKKLLESRGVKFLMSHEVVKIHHIPTLSTVCTFDIRYKNKVTTYTADIFINAMDVKNLAKIYPIIDIIDTSYMELYLKSRQIQTQVLFYLPYRLQKDATPTILILHDSPWFLMIRIEGDLWELPDRDLLSCGIGIWDKPGLNDKCAINCTREEIAEECWRQINRANHKLNISLNKMPKWDIWKSFVFNNSIGALDTHEPKFSNNINTLHLRPTFRDKRIKNLYHATAYTKNDTNIYNMESAAESGTMVAKLIIEKTNDIINNKCATPCND
jgi:uncharacterized protein with NAD-binding domain and iron-sulfur cluster